MVRPLFITAALLWALTSGAGCNRPYSDRNDSDSAATTGDSAVGTSGSLPAGSGVLNDAAVTTRIQARFFLDPAIKVRRIDVDTQAGIVTLRGDVAGDNERAQALLLARTTEGVERVEDALTVNAALDATQPTSAAPASAPAPAPPPAVAGDEALTKLVQSRLGEDAWLKGAAVTVTAKDGVLLLDGTAPTTLAKQRALSIARDTDGVVQVIDRIRVSRAR